MIHGGDVWQSGNRPEAWLDFSANLRPEGPPEWVKAAMVHAMSDVRYYPDLSMNAARRGLAAYLGVPEANVLPTAGGIAGIDLALSMRRGSVFIAAPTFGEYARRAEAHRRQVCEGWSRCEAGDTCVICNPNNPTGSALDRDALLLQAREVSLCGAEMLVDEAFADFCPECSVRDSISDQLTVVGSMTKILGVPGARLGYVCASEVNIGRMEALALPWSLNAFSAAVAAELPNHIDEIRADVLLNECRRDRFAAQLTGLGARVLPSRTNFLLCDFRRDMQPAAEWLKAQGILVRSCASFGLGSSWLRLAIRTESENEKLIGELGKWLLQ